MVRMWAWQEQGKFFEENEKKNSASEHPSQSYQWQDLYRGHCSDAGTLPSFPGT